MPVRHSNGDVESQVKVREAWSSRKGLGWTCKFGKIKVLMRLDDSVKEEEAQKPNSSELQYLDIRDLRKNHQMRCRSG